LGAHDEGRENRGDQPQYDACRGPLALFAHGWALIGVLQPD
jgi:hypothetical protein